jgi:hypothetical protein
MERLRSSNDLVHGLTLASPHTQSDETRGATKGRDKAARRLLVESACRIAVLDRLVLEKEKLENYGDLALALACQTRRGHVLGESTLRSTNATPESETGNAEARH